jgi:hypothetical protein
MAAATRVVAAGARLAAIESVPEAQEDLDCSVTLTRQHRDDCQQRQVFARIDDGPRVTLVFGESVTLDVTPGRHLLRAHNTLFWKRIAFTIEPGERLEFAIINGARFWTAGMAGLLGWAPLFLTVRKISIQ